MQHIVQQARHVSRRRTRTNERYVCSIRVRVAGVAGHVICYLELRISTRNGAAEADTTRFEDAGTSTRSRRGYLM